MAKPQQLCLHGTVLLYSLAVLITSIELSNFEVDSAPIRGPDLASCRPVIPPRRTAADAVDCCFVDTGRAIKEFAWNENLPMRVRRPVHKLDEEFVRKYERAYELMRALPPHDPRSWDAQAKIHCAYSGAAYSQFNSPQLLDVHHGWLVLPFHRWFLYFHERILASLIDDDTFAIPYWAWDVQNETFPGPANIMPFVFANVSSPLYDPHRCQSHLPPQRVDLLLQIEPTYVDPEVMRLRNYHLMWWAMAGDSKTPETFHGGKFVEGDEVKARTGRQELGPHAAVHAWTADNREPFGEDMGPAYSAARDPLFFTHHSQVDRLWLMWKSFGGHDFDDPDWLDAEFLFYDENADMVRVKVQDCLDLEKLKISYEQVPADWLDHIPKSIRDMDDPPYIRQFGYFDRLRRKLLTGELVRSIGVTVRRFFLPKESQTEVVFGRGRAAVTSAVPWSKRSSSQQTMPMEKINNGLNTSSMVHDEVLVISGLVTKPFDSTVLFKLFLELPEADDNTLVNCAESLGNLYIESEGLQVGGEKIVTREFTHKIGIGDRLRILNTSPRQKSVIVTFVPAWKPQHDPFVSVRVTELRIELKEVRWSGPPSEMTYELDVDRPEGIKGSLERNKKTSSPSI